MAENLDIKYMSIAIRLAKRAEGMTRPNPIVGSVIVKNGEIIGKGFHKKAGCPHSEIEAILDAEKKGHDVKGSSIYVTLEPCYHDNKRTLPCVNTIVKKGMSEVIVGCLDQNPEVSGKGIKFLIERGVRMRVGVLDEKCKLLNEAFFKYITTDLPFVTLKLAATLDGKIATSTGDSKWIGSEVQREHAHKLRKKVDAIIIGIETVIRDDPQLNVRSTKRSDRSPVPIVLDNKLRIPLEARLLSIHRSPIIITTITSNPRKVARIRATGARVMIIDPDKTGNIDLVKLINKLGRLQYTSILIEGGSKVAASALKNRIVDKVVFFYSPKIIGAEGISMIGNLDVHTIDKSIDIKDMRISSLGQELKIEGYL